MTDSADNNESLSPEALEIEMALHDGRTRWKYKQVTINNSELIGQLNTYGHFGWELVSMTADYIENYYRQGRLEPTGNQTVLFKMPYWIEQPDE